MESAARSLKAKEYKEAAGELNNALAAGFARPECGFVMGRS